MIYKTSFPFQVTPSLDLFSQTLQTQSERFLKSVTQSRVTQSLVLHFPIPSASHLTHPSQSRSDCSLSIHQRPVDLDLISIPVAKRLFFFHLDFPPCESLIP
jgi:hypothetical protein